MVQKLVYTAFSKHLFYFRFHISKFVFNKGGVPLNPFLISDYFLIDTVERDVVRQANNTIVKRSDEIWVFGKISNGVAKEIILAKEKNKPIRYFSVIDSLKIEEIDVSEVEFEEDGLEFKDSIKH